VRGVMLAGGGTARHGVFAMPEFSPKCAAQRTFAPAAIGE
jgi:hypothetical protein